MDKPYRTAYRALRKLLTYDNNIQEPRTINSYWHFALWISTILALSTMIVLFSGKQARAAEPQYAGYTLNQWANAIHKAEGNDNYGILSVKCTKGGNCRQICKNTVKNNYRRWKRGKSHIPYVRFLQRRYCPIRCFNDPTGLNSNWERNMSYWLRRG